MVRQGHRQRYGTRGQALVELAVVMVLLIMMLVGAVEVGFAYNNYMLAKKAVYSGTLMGAYGGSDNDIKYAVLQGCEGMIATNFLTYSLADTGIEILPSESERSSSIIEYDAGGIVKHRDIGVRMHYVMGMLLPLSSVVYTYEVPVTVIMPMVKAYDRVTAATGNTKIPVCIDDGVALVYGNSYTFTYGGSDDGKYCCLALGGSGANMFADGMTNGYIGDETAGDWVPTEPGDNATLLQEGVAYRLAGHTAHTYANYSTQCAGCPKLVIMPVADLDNVVGKTTVQITRLARFMVTGASGSGE
ncbi:MAG TPA: pilus assembly protein, partial [bacterium]|nr:pilus assembly protein [bacterium]